MAQKGRGGPRTKLQRLCIGATPPQWAYGFAKCTGSFGDGGFGSEIPLEDSSWAEIVEISGTGEFQWNGTGEWDGLPADWSLWQILNVTTPGFLLFAQVYAGGGYWLTIYDYPDGLSWPFPTAGPLTGSVYHESVAPFTPVGYFQVNGRQWHEM